MEMLDKGMILPSGMEQDVSRFHHIFQDFIRTACPLKLMNCLFWNCPFNIFGPQLTVESETTDKGELLC